MATITPFLWFNGEAESAVNFYVSVFENARVTNVMRYGDSGPGEAGSVMTMEFELDGREMMAINAPSRGERGDQDEFAQGKIALLVSCKNQDEVDRLWDALSAGGEELPCGWVCDKFGFAWNIVPDGIADVLGGPDRERSQRAVAAMLKMGKLDIEELRRVYNA